MKIGEAWKAYSVQLDALRSERSVLTKKQKELEGAAGREADYDQITLALEKADEEYDTVRAYVEKIMERRNDLYNMNAALEQGEASQQEFEDLSKYMEIARRIASGAKVPESDVRKLMEFSMEMYIMSTNAAMMNRHKSDEVYESLWKDEEENTEAVDIDEKVENTELYLERPEIEG